MSTRKHIQILLDAEKSTRNQYGGSIMWARMSDDTLSVSCIGYNHMDLADVTEKLIKAGCRYDFAKGIEKFDRISGRTFTYFKEPKVA